MTRALLVAPLLLAWPTGPVPAAPHAVSVERCEARFAAPEYYGIALSATRQVMGTGRATGVVHVTFGSSPFGVALASDGSYRRTLQVQVDHLPAKPQGQFVAWATTPSIEEVIRIGTLDGEGAVSGTVEWNKFLVVITLEPEEEVSTERWSGPIVLRGMSRSGMMHTMAGHGPFEQQECAAFGY